MEEKIRKMKEVINKHYEELSKLPKPDAYQVGGTYYGSTQLYSSVGNHLELLDGCHHTSYGYGCNTDYKDVFAIRIGGAYKISRQPLVDELIEIMGSRYDSKTRIGIIDTHGTNYSVIGFGTIY